ncbi:MAG: class I SAM-dependent methyltransferase [Bacteroidia bacterium]|nr:class I SAM-dependent methyltransferase [Bacteroidia bacterium]
MKRLEIDYSLGAMDALVSLARYNFVIRTMQDKQLKVLDFGCGSGYGTRVLREKFASVKSYDEYPDGYAPDDIDVITDLSLLQAGEFDVITNFEVIEHMDGPAQEKMMDTLAALLNANGTLFISTVRKMDPPPTQNRLETHIKELTFEELYEICHRRFRNVYTFGQIDQTITTFYKENCYHNVFICTGKRA